MDPIIETIRSAVAPDASDEAKAAGVMACRAVLTALEAQPGELLVPGAPVDAGTPTDSVNVTPVPALGPANIAAAVSVMRDMNPEQLLDLAIARLRMALPAGATAPSVEPLKFHIIHVPQLGGRS